MMDGRLTRCGLVLGLLALCCGCGTLVKIESDPTGAKVYRAPGAGRRAYRWRYQGETPVWYYSKNRTEAAKVVWPDGTVSGVKRERLPLWWYVKLYFDRTLYLDHRSPQRRVGPTR